MRQTLAADVAGPRLRTLAVAVLVIGAVRQNRVAAALRRDDYDEISSPLVIWLTVTAVALALVTLAVVAVAL